MNRSKSNKIDTQIEPITKKAIHKVSRDEHSMNMQIVYLTMLRFLKRLKMEFETLKLRDDWVFEKTFDLFNFPPFSRLFRSNDSHYTGSFQAGR